MIKAVIFDLNGVFLDSAPLSARFQRVFGVPVDSFLPALKEIMDEVRKPNAPAAFSLWKPYLEKWHVKLTEPEFFDFWFSGEHLVPEFVDYAKSLREKGLKVFVLSNNFKERTTYYRQNLSEIFKDLDGAYFSWETGFVKPDSEAYKKILNDNGLKAEECLYFDDSDRNIEAARNLGIHAKKFEGFEDTKAEIEKMTSAQTIERE
jgi:HAD superfamily hydrolase (TIGR01509 family)